MKLNAKVYEMGMGQPTHSFFKEIFTRDRDISFVQVPNFQCFLTWSALDKKSDLKHLMNGVSVLKDDSKKLKWNKMRVFYGS